MILKFKKFRINKFLVLVFFISFLPVNAKVKKKLVTDSFVAIRSKKVKMFAGPSRKYPAKYLYARQFYPLKFILKHLGWCKVEDFDGVTGWIPAHLLTKRSTLVAIGTNLVDIYDDKGKIVARAEPGFVLFVSSSKMCKDGVLRYKIYSNYGGKTIKGWVASNKYIWGIAKFGK